MSENNGNHLIDVKDLKVHFPIYSGAIFKRKVGDVKAVDGVSFHILPGETLGLVGESGCGKTTTGHAILRLLDLTGGQVLFKGEDISGYSGSQMRVLRRGMQMIYQDPFSSLNPRMTVLDIVGEPIAVHKMSRNSKDYQDQVSELLEVVGLSASMSSRYPHEFSGGMRQRVGIAMALSCNPELLIADEPTTALDVTIQAQILDLLRRLQARLGMSILLITHDLGVVAGTASRIAVMYAGKIVEQAHTKELFTNPRHPYTLALLHSIPRLDSRAHARLSTIPGTPPDLIGLPPGCRFAPRCANRGAECKRSEPSLVEVQTKAGTATHVVACHRPVMKGEQ